VLARENCGSDARRLVDSVRVTDGRLNPPEAWLETGSGKSRYGKPGEGGGDEALRAIVVEEVRRIAHLEFVVLLAVFSFLVRR
jgi:hypothetical protein